MPITGMIMDIMIIIMMSVSGELMIRLNKVHVSLCDVVIKFFNDDDESFHDHEDNKDRIVSGT